MCHVEEYCLSCNVIQYLHVIFLSQPSNLLWDWSTFDNDRQTNIPCDPNWRLADFVFLGSHEVFFLPFWMFFSMSLEPTDHHDIRLRYCRPVLHVIDPNRAIHDHFRELAPVHTARIEGQGENSKMEITGIDIPDWHFGTVAFPTNVNLPV